MECQMRAMAILCALTALCAAGLARAGPAATRPAPRLGAVTDQTVVVATFDLDALTPERLRAALRATIPPDPNDPTNRTYLDYYIDYVARTRDDWLAQGDHRVLLPFEAEKGDGLVVVFNWALSIEPGGGPATRAAAAPAVSPVPERAAAFAAALQAAGDRPMSMAVVLTDAARRDVTEELTHGHPTPFFDDLVRPSLESHWIALGFTFGDAPTITVQLEQSTEAAAVAFAANVDVHLAEAKRQAADLRAHGWPDEAAALEAFLATARPERQGARLTFNFVPRSLQSGTDALALAFGHPGESPADLKREGKMREIADCLAEYAAAHAGQYPDSLDVLQQYERDRKWNQAEDFLQNPATGERPGYLYAKPPAEREPQRASTLPLLTELADGKPKPGGWVLYADGHFGKSAAK